MPEPCCERDTDSDGNCDRHKAADRVLEGVVLLDRDSQEAVELHAKVLDCYDEHPIDCVCGAESLRQALKARSRR